MSGKFLYLEILQTRQVLHTHKTSKHQAPQTLQTHVENIKFTIHFDCRNKNIIFHNAVSFGNSFKFRFALTSLRVNGTKKISAFSVQKLPLLPDSHLNKVRGKVQTPLQNSLRFNICKQKKKIQRLTMNNTRGQSRERRGLPEVSLTLTGSPQSINSADTYILITLRSFIFL